MAREESASLCQSTAGPARLAECRLSHADNMHQHGGLQRLGATQCRGLVFRRLQEEGDLAK